MQDSDTPIFDAVKQEQGVDDVVFQPFKSHEEFLAEHEHDEWLALVLTLLDDQQVHRSSKAEVPTPRVVTDLTVEPEVHSVNSGD